MTAANSAVPSRTPAAFRNHVAGSAAIEFALIAPMLLAVLVGVLSYGIYFGTANSVQQLAADAARASVAGLDDAERGSIARQHVSEAARSFVLIDASRATVRANVSAANPNLFEVAVSYDASRLSIWAFASLVPLPSSTITRTAVIQRGGY